MSAAIAKSSPQAACPCDHSPSMPTDWAPCPGKSRAGPPAEEPASLLTSSLLTISLSPTVAAHPLSLSRFHGDSAHVVAAVVTDPMGPSRFAAVWAERQLLRSDEVVRPTGPGLTVGLTSPRNGHRMILRSRELKRTQRQSRFTGRRPRRAPKSSPQKAPASIRLPFTRCQKAFPGHLHAVQHRYARRLGA
jgi:hypothetical protein